MTRKICADCRFAVPQHAGAEFAFCHYWPIQAVGPASGSWPPVRIKDSTWETSGGEREPIFASDSWCSKFRPRRWWHRKTK